MENDILLTELHDLDVTRQDGVESPASGFSFIIQKSVKNFSGMTDASRADWEAAEGDPTDPHSVDDGGTDVAARADNGLCGCSCHNTQKDADMTADAPEEAQSEPETAEKAEEVVESTPETSEPQDAPEAAEKSVANDELLARVAKLEEAIQKSEGLAEALAKAQSELEVLKATPIPGGPSLLPSAEASATKAKSDALAKAAHLRARADAWRHDESLAKQYLDLAEAAELEAK